MRRRSKISGSQIVEEGLLLCLALFMMTVILGVLSDVTNMINNFFEQAIEEFFEIAHGLFGI